jgi:hypothetical protein
MVICTANIGTFSNTIETNFYFVRTTTDIYRQQKYFEVVRIVEA